MWIGAVVREFDEGWEVFCVVGSMGYWDVGELKEEMGFMGG